MVVSIFALNVNTITMHGVHIPYWDSSGGYCRAQVSGESATMSIG